MNGSIFLDKEGNEVEIITFGSKLAYFTPKKKFLKEFEPKDEE